MKQQLSNQVNHRHARIVLLSRGGLSNAAIAQHCDCTPTWVRQILHRISGDANLSSTGFGLIPVDRIFDHRLAHGGPRSPNPIVTAIAPSLKLEFRGRQTYFSQGGGAISRPFLLQEQPFQVRLEPFQDVLRRPALPGASSRVGRNNSSGYRTPTAQGISSANHPATSLHPGQYGRIFSSRIEQIILSFGQPLSGQIHLGVHRASCPRVRRWTRK